MKPKFAVPSVSTDQMREVDRIMVEDYGISLLQMMENAGHNLARIAQQWFLELRGIKPVVILAGTGGNGGGSLVCARYLHNWGYPIQVFLTKQMETFKGIPLHQLDILSTLGVKTLTADDLGDNIEPGLIVDGIIGYSLQGNPSGSAKNLIAWANKQKEPVISLDVPSGLDATTGPVFSPIVNASATMTLALPKAGLMKPESYHFVGELYLADIGVPPQLYRLLPLQLDVPNLFEKTDIIRLR